jgi:AraC-like DNA-binding protein
MREHLLDIPIVQGNPKIEKLCAGLCEEMLIKLKGSDKLIETIRNLIIFSPGKFPNLRETAEALQLSPRTLKRRLRERGTTFQKTLDEVRTELAKRYLGETRLNIDQISDLIGFAESSAFRAAFKRWTGKNPSEFRKPTPHSTPINPP